MSRIVRTFSHVRPNQTIHSHFKRRLKSSRSFIGFFEYNRSLIEASLDSLVTIGADGKITDVNAATEQATGCSRQELIGADFSFLFTEPKRARAGYQQVFRDGTVQNYALEIRHRDGHVIPVLYNASVFRNEQGVIVGVFAAARDITEQKLAGEALQELNQELEQKVIERIRALDEAQHRAAELDAVFNSIADGVMLTGSSGEILRLNPAAQRIFDYFPEQYKLPMYQRGGLTKPLKADGQPLAEGGEYPVARALHGETVRNMVLSLTSPNSDRRAWISLSAAPVRNGETVGAVLSFTDISERMEMEKELRQARDEEVKETLYRIAQEAMQNSIKHANPSEIYLELSCSENFIEMLIMDDGRGFDPNQSFPGHLSLRSMSERATRLGGSLVIDSAPGKGTRVQVKLPL